MASRRSTVVGAFGVALVVTLSGATASAQKWKTLASQPQSGGGNAVIEGCNLLTDGSVVCLQSNTNQWHRLRPNASGSYLNGTWDTIAPMPDGVDTRLQGLDITVNPPVLTGVVCNPCTYSPRFFASAVLEDGKMIVIGGENMSTNTLAQVLSNQSGQVQTNIGFVYDPGTNTWGPQLNSAFGSGSVGDAVSVVLADKRFVVADIGSGNMEAFDPATNSLVALNPLGKLDGNDEEGWNLLPDNTFLAVDAGIAGTFEIFNPLGVTPIWSHTGSTPNMFVNGSTTEFINITDFPSVSARSASFEVGPAVLRPDGKLVYFSGNETGQNAVYDSATGLWSHTADMDFPIDPHTEAQISVPDGPAALLPNGDILVVGSPMGPVNCLADGSSPPPFPVCGTFNRPSTVFRFKYDLTTGSTLAQLDAADQPANAPSIDSFEGRFLVLPTGELLFTTQDVAVAQIYSNGETPQDAWRPVIGSGPTSINPGSTNNAISGTLFTGFSQGAGYGDDTQSYTNYPLVRITNNGTGHVVYAKTHGHSRMGLVAVGSTESVSTKYDVPLGTELGASCLQVVVNGIASVCQSVTVTNNHPPVALCKPFTAVANGMCLGSFTPANVDNGSFDPDGDAITSSVAPTGPFGPGPHTVTLTVTDPSGASDHCDAVVTVVDNTPPVLTPPANRSIVTCSENTPVNVGQATATDNCVSPLVPTGRVIAKNGVPLVPPIPVVNGQVTLGIGTFTIQWSVTDGSTPPVTANQTVVVGVNMQASESFLVDDRGQVQNSTGGFAAVLNSGPGLTQVGNDGRSGGVLSVGNVRVLHRAIVNGGATSAGTVFKESDGTITGAITQGASVVLPALPTLPAFPAPTAGSFTVNSGTQSHAPGSYQSGTVNGGTLVLAAGDYFFRSFTINAGTTVRVTPTTRIFVRDALFFNASFRATAGTAVQAIFLGYAGTADLGMFARFDGTLVAPNAAVRFGTGAGLTFTGSFFARVLEVTPASTLVCRVN